MSLSAEQSWRDRVMVHEAKSWQTDIILACI